MARIKATDLLKLIPDEILDKIGKETSVDKINQQLTGKTVFNALLLSLSQTTRMSLRFLEQVYNSAQFKLFNGENQQKAKGRHSSFADRLSKIKIDYFAEIFQHLVNAYHEKIPRTMLSKICRFDATLMKISSKLFNGIDCGGNDNCTFSKIVIGQKGLIPSSIYFCKNNSESSDEMAIVNAIAEATLNSDDIIVFDRGVQSAKTFIRLTNSEAMFVTRIKVGRKHEVLETYYEQSAPNIGSVISDQSVVLWNVSSEIFFSVPFRLIKVLGNQNIEIWILTNIFTMPAEEITEIYRRRWDIEVLFRFIKQELNLKHFLARNLNGLRAYMYMILIMSILLLMYKTANSLTGFKFVKIAFFQDIENAIICDLITVSGGNPAIFLKRVGFS